MERADDLLPHYTIGHMKPSTRWFGALVAVFVLSVVLLLALPVDWAMRELATIPAVGSLVAALFQIFREQAALERQLLLQRDQQMFSVGAMSHMANVAFDKHVAFAEKYIAEVHSTVSTFFREGPTQKALEHAIKFADLRQEYAAWLPISTAIGLKPFEDAVRQIGALKGLVNDLRGSGDPERPKALSEMYTVFRNMLQLTGSLPIDEQPEMAIDVVVQRIREIIGIEQLTTLRRNLIEQAIAQAKRGA
jgi:hypothetical protein